MTRIVLALVLTTLALPGSCLAQAKPWIDQFNHLIRFPTAEERVELDEERVATEACAELFRISMSRDYRLDPRTFLLPAGRFIEEKEDIGVPSQFVAKEMQSHYDLARAYCMACEQASPFVVGVALRRGFLVFRENIYSLATDRVHRHARYCSLVAQRVWRQLDESEQKRCQMFDPDFAAEASGENETRLKELNAAIVAQPRDGELVFERALIHRRRWNLNAMQEDLRRAIDLKCKSFEFALYLRGEHLMCMSSAVAGTRILEQLREHGVTDQRIDRQRLAEFVSLSDM